MRQYIVEDSSENQEPHLNVDCISIRAAAAFQLTELTNRRYALNIYTPLSVIESPRVRVTTPMICFPRNRTTTAG